MWEWGTTHIQSGVGAGEEGQKWRGFRNAGREEQESGWRNGKLLQTGQPEKISKKKREMKEMRRQGLLKKPVLQGIKSLQLDRGVISFRINISKLS